jgi:hypothetical protein
MNQIPDWNKLPSGNKTEGPATPKRSAGLLFSGALIAVSLLAFILPLAAFHVAQVASVLRVRRAIFLLLAVSLTLYALGVVGRLPVFAMAGSAGILCSPLLALVLTIRARNSSVWWALVILALPVAVLLFSLLNVPQGFNLENWIVAELARLPDQPGLDKAQILAQFKASQALEPLQKLFNLSDAQRVAWFLFAESGALSVSVLASLAGTLVLIDFAFAQPERIRGVIEYVLRKTGEFPQMMVGLLQQTADNLTGISASVDASNKFSQQSVIVLEHEKKPPKQTPASADVHKAWYRILSALFREPLPSGAVDVFGYRFRFSQSPGWNFRRFAVPLWLSLPALGVLVFVASRWSGDDAAFAWLPVAPQGLLWAWAAFAALSVLIGLAMQGALVIHARLRPFAGLLAILFVLILVSSLDGGALTLVALLGGLGLLDHAYDFRKRLAKTQNAV